MGIDGRPVKGRGTDLRVPNRFQDRSLGFVHGEGIDEYDDGSGAPTRFVEVFPKSILNKVSSPDLGLEWSVNPYQGCEHGCAYCYARPTHEYWGYGAGSDFERIVLVKRQAPRLLDKALRSRSWAGGVISLSGNTDCYQPVERRERITRQLLEVAQAFNQPISIVTKNALVLRDLDILAEMARHGLVHVALSLTTLDEELRRRLEPRTSTMRNRLQAIERLNEAGVPVRALLAPIIPGLNDHELPALLKAAAEAGARDASYSVVRLNGAVEPVFRRWLEDHAPLRARKVIAQVSHLHGGTVGDSVFGRRMKGEGAFAENINRLFKLFRTRYFHQGGMPALDRSLFRVPPQGQLDLFADI